MEKKRAAQAGKFSTYSSANKNKKDKQSSQTVYPEK